MAIGIDPKKWLANASQVQVHYMYKQILNIESWTDDLSEDETVAFSSGAQLLAEPWCIVHYFLI